jgi:hypothetical protein
MSEIILIYIMTNVWTGHMDRTIIASYESREECEKDKNVLLKDHSGSVYLCAKPIKEPTCQK